MKYVGALHVYRLVEAWSTYTTPRDRCAPRVRPPPLFGGFGPPIVC